MKMQKLGSALSILVGFMASSAAYSATIYNANDWYGFSGQMASITQGASTSPTVNYNAATGIGTVWSYFAPNSTPVTLLDGMTLTLNTAVIVDYADGVTPVAQEFRFGIFDSGSRPSTPSTDAGRVVASTYGNGWTGFLTSDIQNSASNSNRIWRRDTGTSTGFTSSTDTTKVGLTDGFSSLAIFADNVGLTLTLSLSRSGDNLSFFGTLGADAFSGTYANAFASSYPATFDTVGFWGNNGIGAMSSVTFSNTTLTLVPEPSTGLLLLGAMGGFALFRRVRGRING